MIMFQQNYHLEDSGEGYPELGLDWWLDPIFYCRYSRQLVDVFFVEALRLSRSKYRATQQACLWKLSLGPRNG